MKDQAQIVIVGGGIVGVQIAYHLAKKGVTDIVCSTMSAALGSRRAGSNSKSWKEA